jgi:hypothetical protein
MRFTKTLIAAAAATTVAGAAMAGGFSDTITETPVTIVAPVEPAGSLPGWVIPAVLVAGLVALAASGEGS